MGSNPADESTCGAVGDTTMADSNTSTDSSLAASIHNTTE